MTTHSSCYELTSSRHTSAPTGRIDLAVQQSASVTPEGVTGSDVPIPLPSPVPFSAYGTIFNPLQYLRALVVTDDVSDLVYLEADKGFSTVQLNGAATLNGVAMFDVETLVNTAFRQRGRMTPGIQLAFGSAVQTTLAALTGTIQTYVLNMLHRQSNQVGYVGHAHFIDFEDQPPATGAISSEAGNLLAKLSDGGSPTTLGISASGPITALNCSLAGIAPEGAVYIRPEDIGNAAEQIPASVTANSKAHFRFHPSVFVRRSAYYNGIMRRVQDPLDVAVPNLAQPLRIVSVTQDPLSSNWMLLIDGQMSLVSILHPDGSDLRRPRDIWNQVLSPAIEGSASARAAITVGIPGSSQSSVGVLARLKYVEYARCLPLAGTDVPQTDAVPVG